MGGFEPTTFRSESDNTNHCATEAAHVFFFVWMSRFSIYADTRIKLLSFPLSIVDMNLSRGVNMNSRSERRKWNHLYHWSMVWGPWTGKFQRIASLVNRKVVNALQLSDERAEVSVRFGFASIVDHVHARIKTPHQIGNHPSAIASCEGSISAEQ